jgi:Tol biopolymer transport system component
MRNIRARGAGWALLALATTAAVLAASAGTASAAPATILISQNAAGQPGNGHSFFPSVTANGQFVVFRSTSGNLVPGHHTVREVFLLDRVFGHGLEVVSLADDGSPSNGHSGNFTQATPNGRLVVFDSLGSNLVAGDTNNTFDVFVRIRFGGTHTERVSVATGGGQADGASFAQGISQDGRFVLFTSDATNLVPGDTNKAADLFIRDRAYQRTLRINLSSTGEQADNYVADAKISPSGRYVVFRSPATNLVPGDTNGRDDVFLIDRFTRKIELITVDSNGVQLPGGGGAPSVSADGRYVAFTGNDGTGRLQVLLRDRVAGTTRQVSVSSTGEPANSLSLRPSISANGRYLAFESGATNLVVPNLSGPQQQVYVRDLQAGRTVLASVSNAGKPGNSVSFFPAVTDTGGVTFQSLAFNLLPPGAHSGSYQVYFRST